MAKQTLNIETGLKQQLKLTPMQVQFVRMLEMNGPEIEDEVARALTEMPALEVDDPADFEPLPIHPEDNRVGDISPQPITRFQNEGYLPAAYNPDTYTEPVTANAGETLLEALERQLDEQNLSDTDRLAAKYIIGSIDDNGYLTRSLTALSDDLAINEGIELSPEHMHQLLIMVQSFDPAGVGATDLKECLLLQLQRKPRSAESITAIEVVKNHFDLLGKRHFDRIASILDISREQLNDALNLIAHLNPKPGNSYQTSGVPDSSWHISPDFMVEVDPNGRTTLTSLSRLPKLRVAPSFNDESDGFNTESTASDSRAEESRRFVRAKRDDARNFIRLVDQRRQTLANVVEAIVRLQQPFFITEADEDIQPMVLRDIARLTGYDLSVVSRATQGKYIATLRGVYPLKKFFNEKVRADNNDITSNRIISQIRKAIEAEDSSHPLSDREITNQLSAAGFDIARRTVAKYRENLGFPVARLRKQ